MMIGYPPFPEIGTEIFALEMGGFRLALRWYALAYIIGLFVGWRICARTIGRADFWTTAEPPLSKRQLEGLFAWIVAGVIIGVLLLFLAWRSGWLRSPGRLTGLFFLGYGSSRVFIEFFRQPDMQFFTPDNPFGHALHWGKGGVTMGQSLSIPMILVGATLVL